MPADGGKEESDGRERGIRGWGPRRQGEARGRAARPRASARLARPGGPPGARRRLLRDRPAGARARPRRRRQDHRPAGRDEGDRGPVLRQGPARPAGDRPGRLRDLAADPRRRRPRRRTARRHRRPRRRPRQRHRLRGALRRRDRHPRRLRVQLQLPESEGNDGRRPRLVRRHGPRRDRRAGPDRRRHLPGLQGPLAQLPRRREDGRDERVGAQGLHRARRVRAGRAGGRSSR